MKVVRHLALVFALGGVAHAAERADLACVERYFGVKPEGSVTERLRGRSDDERLERPTIADMFEPPYERGPVKPVTDPHQDPGRARVEAIFRVAYPERTLIEGRFFGQRVKMQEKVLAALARVEERLAKVPEARPFVTRLGGTYNPRKIAGTDRASAHTWGIAIDLNPDKSHYWRWSKTGWQNKIPQSVVDAFEAEGFIWGGRWYHFDTMHFEYRPELLDPTCY